MPINEFQKPFSKKGYLNAEIITRENYHGNPFDKDRCACPHCEAERDKLKRKVNRLMGRKFYEGADDG